MACFVRISKNAYLRKRLDGKNVYLFEKPVVNILFLLVHLIDESTRNVLSKSIN